MTNPTGSHNPRDWFRALSRWKRWGLIALAIFVVFAVIGALSGTDSGTNTTPKEASDRPQTQPTAAPKTVDLSVANDARDAHVARYVLRGSVTPGASVKVDGKSAKVRGGRWSRPVPLDADACRTTCFFTVAAKKPGYEDAYMRAVMTRKLTTAERAAIAEAKRQREARARAAREARIAAKRQRFIATAVTIPYKQLIKDPERYSGKHVAYRGQIFQIQESGGEGILLLSVTDEGYDIWTDEVWVNYSHPVSAAEDDIITVYGTVVGSKSYETQVGGERYVPEIDAKYVVE